MNKTAVAGALLFCISIALSACSDDTTPIPSERQAVQEAERETFSTVGQESELLSGQEIREESVSEPVVESTEEPSPLLTEEYKLICEKINLFNGSHYAAFQLNTHGDLYMRRLQDDSGEYIELSLWSDQKEVWYTIDDDTEEYNDLFYEGHSERLTLGQKQCYYVIELDGIICLMRYWVETEQNAVTMSYKVFGIRPMYYSFEGYESVFDIGSMTLYLVSNGEVDREVSFPVEQMTAFADTVKGYMENGHLAVSTLQGIFEVSSSADQDNPVFPYLYDIFPWLPELAAQCGVDMEGIRSSGKLLTAVQSALPVDASVAMPDVAADGSYFITGEYYNDGDESYLTVRRQEDGSYKGLFLLQNALYMDYTGYYDNGILICTQTDHDSDQSCYEMEVSFQNGKATVTMTAVEEEYFIDVGETLILDRNEKPEEVKSLKIT
ncbi:MAG: hypothetical protein NC123_04975 [Butyrivibrio sp.]|nr:hypothetical protein [Acetatifactor muris]MCM1558880.1 hypothetical protein [Butyrivibrio sp.]